MLLKKNTTLGKIKLTKILFYLLIFFYFTLNTYASQNNKNLEGNFVEIKILDKVSSKNSELTLKIGEETKFENLLIKSLKCKNSEFGLELLEKVMIIKALIKQEGSIIQKKYEQMLNKLNINKQNIENFIKDKKKDCIYFN